MQHGCLTRPQSVLIQKTTCYEEHNQLIQAMLTASSLTFMTLRVGICYQYFVRHCNLHRSLSQMCILLKDVYLVPCISLKCSVRHAAANKSTL